MRGRTQKWIRHVRHYFLRLIRQHNRSLILISSPLIASHLILICNQMWTTLCSKKSSPGTVQTGQVIHPPKQEQDEASSQELPGAYVVRLCDAISSTQLFSRHTYIHAVNPPENTHPIAFPHRLPYVYPSAFPLHLDRPYYTLSAQALTNHPSLTRTSMRLRSAGRRGSALQCAFRSGMRMRPNDCTKTYSTAKPTPRLSVTGSTVSAR